MKSRHHLAFAKRAVDFAQGMAAGAALGFWVGLAIAAAAYGFWSNA